MIKFKINVDLSEEFWLLSTNIYGGAHSIMVIYKLLAIWVQIMDKAIYISHSTNTLGKGINPIIQLWINNRADWSL